MYLTESLTSISGSPIIKHLPRWTLNIYIFIYISSFFSFILPLSLPYLLVYNSLILQSFFSFIFFLFHFYFVSFSDFFFFPTSICYSLHLTSFYSSKPSLSIPMIIFLSLHTLLPYWHSFRISNIQTPLPLDTSIYICVCVCVFVCVCVYIYIYIYIPTILFIFIFPHFSNWLFFYDLLLLKSFSCLFSFSFFQTLFLNIYFLISFTLSLFGIHLRNIDNKIFTFPLILSLSIDSPHSISLSLFFTLLFFTFKYTIFPSFSSFFPFLHYLFLSFSFIIFLSLLIFLFFLSSSFS